MREISVVADQSLAVEQGCTAAIADGPVGEVEHMDDLLGQDADVPLLAEQLHTPLFGHTLYMVMGIKRRILRITEIRQILDLLVSNHKLARQRDNVLTSSFQNNKNLIC